ncbi:hypothetical protein F4806DRAFT_97267 [Annulohypoxylon nitens]|nr:hypothetical protein F4806DRAFT_97267 [Annulohypoxylon nitens]
MTWNSDSIMPETLSESLSEGDEVSMQQRSIPPPVPSSPSVGRYTSSFDPSPDIIPLPGANTSSQNISQSTSAPQRNSSEENRNLASEDGRFENLRIRLQTKTSSADSDEPSSWWWWWEILAIFLSTLCMCGLVGVLIKIDNLPLQSWELPVEPNSLIASLITIAKASMMLVVASGISQLKWRHFMIQQRRLADLQIYDDASRGPWGSAMLLWNLGVLRIRALVTIGFALITIVALGMDTTAQQILKFPMRESPLKNATVELGIAHSYTSKGVKQQTQQAPWQAKSDILSLQSAMINGVIGTVYKQYFTCPQRASRCQWNGTFTTLGICGTVADNTDRAIHDCGPINDYNTTYCNYTIPGTKYITQKDMAITWEAIEGGGYENRTTWEIEGTTIFQSQFWSPLNVTTAHLGYFMAVNATTDGLPRYNSSTHELDPPLVKVYSGTFDWCAQTYRDATGSRSDISEESVSTEYLTLNGLDMDGPDGVIIKNIRLVANSTGLTYKVDTYASFLISQYFQKLFTFTIQKDTGNENFPDMGPFLQHSDLNKVFIDIADTLTNQFRSRSGDNYNASIIEGEAFFEETYIHVRWGWIALPLAEVLLTAILLVVSIKITRNQPLLKESVMALLISELEGWDEDELNMSGPPTQEKLDELAEKMTARFEAGGLGCLKFQRE